MVLFTTNLSSGGEAVVRLDNDNSDVVRSIAVGVTSVVTPHESNTRKAKEFFADAFATTSTSLREALGEAAEAGDIAARWNLPDGHAVLTSTTRSVRLTFYSPSGLVHAEAAANAKVAMAGVEKKKKAPAPWRVRPA
jgi:hypothetical protein